jgi:hypothetical protein
MKHFDGSGPCLVVMRDSALLPGMTMPLLAPPPADPHPNPVVERMRAAWDLRIVAWEGVWGSYRPRPVRHGEQMLPRAAPPVAASGPAIEDDYSDASGPNCVARDRGDA